MATKTRPAGIDKKHLNTKVRPQDDFYEYACGGWIKRHKIPATESRWSTFDVLIEKSRNQLHDIVKRVAKNTRAKRGSDEQLVRDLWLSGMDQKRRNRLAFTPIQSLLRRIDTLASMNDMLTLIPELHKSGIDALWGTYVGRDDKNSARNVLHLVQAGISLPDRDYYLKEDEDSRRVRDHYVRYITKLWKLAAQKNGATAVDTIMSIETELAKASMTRVERRDPDLQYNPRTVAQLQEAAQHIDWHAYFSAMHAKNIRDLIVSQPLFITAVSALTQTFTLEEWKVYLTWKVLDGTRGLLHDAAARIGFDFYGKALSGTKKMQPLWKRIVGVIDGCIGDALGKLYVKEHFKVSAKRRINTLVDNLFAVYRQRIVALTWMSAATKAKAIEKLGQMNRKLGYPKKWKSYRGVVCKKDDYFGNIMRISEYECTRMMRKLDKKPDPDEWFMSAPTVNAYFHPNYNEIVFPAGIMQPPFFDERADDAVNYGGIGSVIGHEITHGFDDEGRKFDGKGNLQPWWTDDDARKFKEKVQVVADQFSAFQIVGMHVNGDLTLGENIADLGGLVMAFEAYKKTPEYKSHKPIDGFTPTQRFFLGYAMTEAGSMRPEAQKKRIVTDPHSPSKFRVNGPLAHMDVFIDAFGVTNRDKMYLDKSKRALIW